MHQSEALANLTNPLRSLFEWLDRGELHKLLRQGPRTRQPSASSVRRLSPADVDRLVADYQAGVGSIYVLADRFGVHRHTIAAHLKERGVQLGKQPLDEAEIAHAQALHTEGLSLNAIGRELRRDPKTVKAVIAEGASREIVLREAATAQSWAVRAAPMGDSF